MPRPRNDDVLDVRALDKAVEPRHAVAALSAFGLTEQDLAAATGAHVRTVRRWKAPDAQREPSHHTRQIDDLRTLVARMAATGAMTDRAIVFWLRSRNRWLNDMRPLEVLAKGTDEDFERVRGAADLFIDPNADVSMELFELRAHDDADQ